MNLAFGSLYSWSVFVLPFEKQFGWHRAQTSMVFTIAVAVVSLAFILSGWIHDKWGPLPCAFGGGALASFGFFLCGSSHSLASLYCDFGLIGGLGAGLGGAVVIPVIAKSFPRHRGLAIGAVLAAYAAGSAIFGPLTEWYLLPTYELKVTFEILGAVFFVMTMIGAVLLTSAWELIDHPESIESVRRSTPPSLSPYEVLNTRVFYCLWIGYACGCTSGLMIISQLIPFTASISVTPSSLGSAALVIGAVASGLGRVLSGWLSDGLGRINVLRLMIGLSAFATPLLYAARASVGCVVIILFVIYYCYGTQLSVNAAACSDLWGVENSGLNYGLLFTAWGTAGVVGPRLAGVFYDRYHDYRLATYSAGLLALIALIAEGFVKSERERTDQVLV